VKYFSWRLLAWNAFTGTGAAARAQHFGNAKIRNFHPASFVEQQVLRLDVAMDNAPRGHPLAVTLRIGGIWAVIRCSYPILTGFRRIVTQRDQFIFGHERQPGELSQGTTSNITTVSLHPHDSNSVFLVGVGVNHWSQEILSGRRTAQAACALLRNQSRYSPDKC